MANLSGNARTETMIAGAAVAKYRFLKQGTGVKVIQSAAEGDYTFCVSLSAAGADGDPLTVAWPYCKCPIEAGAALSAGALVETDASGRAVAQAGAASRPLGFIEEAAAGAGSIVTLVFYPAPSVT